MLRKGVKVARALAASHRGRSCASYKCDGDVGICNRPIPWGLCTLARGVHSSTFYGCTGVPGCAAIVGPANLRVRSNCRHFKRSKRRCG